MADVRCPQGPTGADGPGAQAKGQVLDGSGFAHVPSRVATEGQGAGPVAGSRTWRPIQLGNWPTQAGSETGPFIRLRMPGSPLSAQHTRAGLLSALARVPPDSLRWVEVRARMLQERSRTPPKRPAIRCRNRSASLGPHSQRRTGDCAQAVADPGFSGAQLERNASIHELAGPESLAAVPIAARPGRATRPASDTPNGWVGVLQMRRGARDSLSESGRLAKACSILAAGRLLLPLDTRWRRAAALNAFGHTARDRGAGGIRRRSYRFFPGCPRGRSAVDPALELHAYLARELAEAHGEVDYGDQYDRDEKASGPDRFGHIRCYCTEAVTAWRLVTV